MAVQAAARPSSGALKTLVDFYDATNAADSRGRTLAEMLAWPDSRLESCHNYIQILFPLPEGSVFNYTAPVLDEAAFLWLRSGTSSGEAMLRNVRGAFERIMSFYGFGVAWNVSDALVPSVVVEEKAGAARQNLPNWVCARDHNHLRITRILRSLRVLGLEDEARAFFEALGRIREKYGRIGAQSFRFWKRAAELPLYMAPDGGTVEWLRKYHEGKGPWEGEDRMN